ncbi:1-phosphofructokinase [Vibrio ulleungensis]|uniref:Phosphofructokinase n=1 Tax=Vibrio ulleungensis TaxID=2807619 RepID=A0ABS2HEX6_9VIBR|nr:1-phosphofructokinase [Vibrio ulleungensis]MBM7036130.1 1-phosphofructokinase [Vibrio ulleungensis]
MLQNVAVISLNPALDLTGDLEVLKPGQVNKALSATLMPAGKGVNVAKVLSDLGAGVTLCGFLGRDNKGDFERYFIENGIDNQCILVNGSTRTNIKIVDAQQSVTDINFQGFGVTDKDVERLEQQLFSLAKQVNYFVFSGSLPMGMSPKIAANWIAKLKRLGKSVVLDSSGEMLTKGVSALPSMIKPNEHELAELSIGLDLTTDATDLITQCSTAAQALQSDGIECIVVSLGENGLIWIESNKRMHATPLTINVTSTVGAGDSVVAGYVWAKLNGYSPEKSAAFCTAMGTYAVTQVGVGVSSVSDITAMSESVIVRSL